MKILHSTQNVNKQNQDRYWLSESYEKFPKHILDRDYKAEWKYGRAFNISIYEKKVSSQYGLPAIFCFFLYIWKISKLKKKRYFLVYIKQSNVTVIDNLISDAFNLSYPQKQKILPPLYKLCFSSLMLSRSTRLCFGKQKVTEERESNMKQCICEM